MLCTATEHWHWHALPQHYILYIVCCKMSGYCNHFIICGVLCKINIATCVGTAATLDCMLFIVCYNYRLCVSYILAVACYSVYRMHVACVPVLFTVLMHICCLLCAAGAPVMFTVLLNCTVCVFHSSLCVTQAFYCSLTFLSCSLFWCCIIYICTYIDTAHRLDSHVAHCMLLLSCFPCGFSYSLKLLFMFLMEVAH